MYVVSLQRVPPLLEHENPLQSGDDFRFSNRDSLRCLDLVIMRLVSGRKFASIGVKYQKENSFSIRLDESCRLRQLTLDVVIAARL